MNSPLRLRLRARYKVRERFENVCVCLRVGPMVVGCAGCCSIFGEVESLGCCSIFGEVESQGLVAESTILFTYSFLTTVLLLILSHFYSVFPFCMHFAQIKTGDTVWY